AGLGSAFGSGFTAWADFKDRSWRKLFQLRNASFTVPSSNVTVRPSTSDLPVSVHVPSPAAWIVTLVADIKHLPFMKRNAVSTHPAVCGAAPSGSRVVRIDCSIRETAARLGPASGRILSPRRRLRGM